MAYAIMRSKKLSGTGSVAASLQHCHRERETRNADSDRSVFNEHLVDATSTDQAMGKLRDLLPEKRRKDAVLVVEYVMTASPEWWQTASSEDQHEFFKRSLDWLDEKYGKQNIITATIHRDELTPHLSAFVVPLTTDGRLSAKEFIGNRTKMRNDQTTFAERVQSLGLTRGIEGSKATHQRVKSHYGALQQADKKHQPISLEPDTLKQKILKKTLITTTVETPEEMAQRIHKEFSNAVNKARHPDTEKLAVMKHQERKAKAQRKLLEERSTELAKFKNGLSEKQVSLVLKLAEDLQQKNQRDQQERKQQREKQRQQKQTRTPRSK